MMLTRNERNYLKKARARVKNDDNEFICWALECVSYGGTKRLRAYISNKLGGPGYSLEDWQHRKNIFHNRSQRKQHRLDWIDWMLGEK